MGKSPEQSGHRPSKWRGKPEQVGGLVSAVLDPVLARRAGMTSALLGAWPEIVSGRLADTTRPQKINWPRRASEDDPFKPATLVVAAEGMAALHLQHQTGEIIQRVNAFFGFEAVDRLQLVHKAVAPAHKPPRRAAPLPREAEERLKALADGIEDEALREALIRLGRSVKRERG
ncbi:DUF721 domain-containing protein [Oricola cellulosilytica]|uniref:DUF721 domain-containing protein n=1 Tax=Oricola cellulosilytica TaxID=1429082 RepID=UPI0026A4C0F1